MHQVFINSYQFSVCQHLDLQVGLKNYLDLKKA